MVEIQRRITIIVIIHRALYFIKLLKHVISFPHSYYVVNALADCFKFKKKNTNCYRYI